MNSYFLPVEGGIVEIETGEYFNDLKYFSDYIREKYFNNYFISIDDIAKTVYFYLESYYRQEALVKAKQLSLHNS